MMVNPTMVTMMTASGNRTGGYPDNNPKTAFGRAKAPLRLVPPASIAQCSLAFKLGAEKYGPYNWREHSISASVYYEAAMRHWMAYWDGEDLDPESGAPHVAHAMACCALLLDAMAVGKLNDDRPIKGGMPQVLAEIAGTAQPKEGDGGIIVPVRD
jgi:hypothetical protein